MWKKFYLYNNDLLIKNGVKIYDPNITYIGENVKIGKDVEIYPNTYVLGESFDLAGINKIYVVVNNDSYKYYHKELHNVDFLFQDKINGTGSAFYCVNGLFSANDEVIVINSDCFLFDKSKLSIILLTILLPSILCNPLGKALWNLLDLPPANITPIFILILI